MFQCERDVCDRLVNVSLSIEEKEIGPIGAIESAIDKIEAGEVDELKYQKLRRLMEFIADPKSDQAGVCTGGGTRTD